MNFQIPIPILKRSITVIPIILLMLFLILFGFDKEAPLGLRIIVGAIYTVVFSYLVLYVKLKVEKNPKKLLYILAAVFVNLLFIYPVLKQGGWPENHEYLGWRSRIVCYIYHFYQYDFLPFWSSGDALGLGSPLPLYYHKVFNYIAGLNFVLIGNIKTSMIFSLFFLNFIGTYGLYRSFKLLNIDTLSAFCLSQTLLFLNYTITEWIVRGAFAEYSAMMVVPWLLWWALNLLETKKISYSIILIMFVLYHAHNIIAFYGIFGVCLAIVLRLFFTTGKKDIVLIFKKSLISFCVFLFLQLVYFYPMYILNTYYNPGKIKLNIADFFHNFSCYIYDTNYHWGTTWQGYSVEIGMPFWIFLFISLASIFFSLFLLRNKHTYRLQVSKLWAIIIFAFFVLLQLKESIYFYNHFPGADFIQFPWRLNVFIQSLGLLIISMNSFWKSKYTAIGFLAISIGLYPILTNLSPEWNWFQEKYLEEKVNSGVWGIGEYIPNITPVENENQTFFKELSDKGIELSNKDCMLKKQEYKNPEQLEIMFQASCISSTEVVFPYCYSGIEYLEIINDDECKQIEVNRTNSDPRIRAIIPEGDYTLKLYLPQLKNVFLKMF